MLEGTLEDPGDKLQAWASLQLLRRRISREANT